MNLQSGLLANVWFGTIVVVGITAATIALMLYLRRSAPEGGYFRDADRAAGIFGSIGSLFSILLALVVFLSVEGYAETQSQVNAEADSVLEQFQIAKFFQSQEQYAIQSQLVCYGRSVRDQEWLVDNREEGSQIVSFWASSIDSVTDSIELSGPEAEAGFDIFLRKTLDRQKERRGRLEGASGALPNMVWPILILGTLGVMIYLLTYADSAERAKIQGLQVGLITLLLTTSLLLVNALNNPFTAVPGKILPDKMQSSLESMEADLSILMDTAELEAVLPCDAEGRTLPPDPPIRDFPIDSTMAAIVERGYLRVGVTYSRALFGEIDPISGELSGFDIDLAKELARELGLKQEQIEFIDIQTSDRLPALQEGRVDLVVRAMTITPERAQIIDFSSPYYLAGQSLMIKSNNRSITGIRDLTGKDVCAVAGSTAVSAMREQAPGANLFEATSHSDCLEMLQSGDVDAYPSDDIILAGFTSVYDGLTLVGGQFTEEPYGVGIPKDQVGMVEFVNGVIDEMIRDGRWGRNYYQYLADIPGLPSVGEAKQRLNQIR